MERGQTQQRTRHQISTPQRQQIEAERSRLRRSGKTQSSRSGSASDPPLPSLGPLRRSSAPCAFPFHAQAGRVARLARPGRAFLGASLPPSPVLCPWPHAVCPAPAAFQKGLTRTKGAKKKKTCVFLYPYKVETKKEVSRLLFFAPDPDPASFHKGLALHGKNKSLRIDSL